MGNQPSNITIGHQSNFIQIPLDCYLQEAYSQDDVPQNFTFTATAPIVADVFNLTDVSATFGPFPGSLDMGILAIDLTFTSASPATYRIDVVSNADSLGNLTIPGISHSGEPNPPINVGPITLTGPSSQVSVRNVSVVSQIEPFQIVQYTCNATNNVFAIVIGI